MTVHKMISNDDEENVNGFPVIPVYCAVDSSGNKRSVFFDEDECKGNLLYNIYDGDDECHTIEDLLQSGWEIKRFFLIND
jgi:hypothetical protein